MTPKAAVDVADAAFWEAVATGYDSEPLRYASFCADRMVAALAPRPGTRLLDVACGTGAVTLAAAQAVGPGGRVMAVDSAEPMLERLDAKRRKFALANVDVQCMDGARLDFRRDYFNAVVCSLALFWFREPRRALGEWRRVLRPGGELMVSSFAPGAFEPALGALRAQLAAAGVPAAQRVLPWEAWADAASLAALLTGAGFEDVAVERVELGYRLADVRQWWEVVQSSALRVLLAPLAPAARASLESAHLAALAALVDADGLRMGLGVYIARGRKPAA